MKISGKKVAILATHGFEQSELEVPRDKLKAAGATVHIISPEEGEIKGWDKKDWGRPVKIDRHLGDVSIDEYDAIVLPGGQINPDLLRVNAEALEFMFFRSEKSRGGDLSRAVAVDRDGHHQGPQGDLLSFDQDRLHQCRREMGGVGSGR